MDRLRYLALVEGLRFASLDTSEMVIKHFHYSDIWTFLIFKGEELLGGCELAEKEEGWWLLDSLYSNSATSLYILLLGTLQTVGKILPSQHISPAANAVVESFYRKYKGTEVVEEDVWGGLLDHLRAGYVWSPKLRQVPVRIEKVSDYEELSELKVQFGRGFGKAYDDNSKTKRRDLNFALKTQKGYTITDAIESNLKGHVTRYKVLPWLKANENRLRELGLLETVLDAIDYQTSVSNINLKQLEIDSFDPTHEYYGGKLGYEH